MVALSITLSILLTRKTTESNMASSVDQRRAHHCLMLMIGQRGAAAAFLRWNATGTIVAGLGSGGITGNPVVNPYGFTLDETNRIYVAEYFGHRISRWVQQATNGTVIAGSIVGNMSSRSNGFSSPSDVLLESNGDMYVVDRWNYRLQFWPNGAASGTTIAGQMQQTGYIVVNALFLSRVWLEYKHCTKKSTDCRSQHRNQRTSHIDA